MYDGGRSIEAMSSKSRLNGESRKAVATNIGIGIGRNDVGTH